MTRIISGAARGVVLSVPASGTRPTGDRVRESMFGALESAGAVAGARVLDLYAGSGALGLEALSRGASAVDLVERSAAAARVAQANAARVRRSAGSDAAVRVHRSTVTAFLAATTGTFELVLADPPYDLDHDEVARLMRAVAEHMAPDALLVIERSARSADPVPTDALGIERHRRYGDTALWWLRRTER